MREAVGRNPQLCDQELLCSKRASAVSPRGGRRPEHRVPTSSVFVPEILQTIETPTSVVPQPLRGQQQGVVAFEQVGNRLGNCLHLRFEVDNADGFIIWLIHLRKISYFSHTRKRINKRFLATG